MIDYHLAKRDYLEESKKKLKKQIELSEFFRKKKQKTIISAKSFVLYIYAFYVVLHLCCSYLCWHKNFVML